MSLNLFFRFLFIASFKKIVSKLYIWNANKIILSKMLLNSMRNSWFYFLHIAKRWRHCNTHFKTILTLKLRETQQLALATFSQTEQTKLSPWQMGIKWFTGGCPGIIAIPPMSPIKRTSGPPRKRRDLRRLIRSRKKMDWSWNRHWVWNHTMLLSR